MRAALAAAFLLALAALPVAAYEDSDWSVAGYGELMSAGNLGKHLASELSSVCGTPSGAAAGCSGSYSARGGYGGRLGIYHVVEDTRIGLSAGALTIGPNRISLATANPAGSFEAVTHGTIVRLLAEGGHKFPLNDSFAGALGLGLGVADFNQTSDWTCSGWTATACANSQSGTVDLGAFAWEMSGSVIFEGFELGLRLSAFTRAHFLPLTAVGYFAGYRF